MTGISFFHVDYFLSDLFRDIGPKTPTSVHIYQLKAPANTKKRQLPSVGLVEKPEFEAIPS
jgi:hypothetical protein